MPRDGRLPHWRESKPCVHAFFWMFLTPAHPETSVVSQQHSWVATGQHNEAAPCGLQRPQVGSSWAWFSPPHEVG